MRGGGDRVSGGVFSSVLLPYEKSQLIRDSDFWSFPSSTFIDLDFTAAEVKCRVAAVKVFPYFITVRLIITFVFISLGLLSPFCFFWKIELCLSQLGGVRGVEGVGWGGGGGCMQSCTLQCDHIKNLN